jgi:hypothetical protein
VTVPREEVPSLLGAVLVNDEETRVPYPGLALAHEVGRLHGGRLVARDSSQGTVLSLRLPG